LGLTGMQISYIVDKPDLVAGLIPGLLEHWREISPEQTFASRAAKFREHMNREVLPIAWLAHEGETAAGTAALRTSDLDGREDLGPWLGGVYVEPSFRGRGIASSLCRVVVAKARDLGFRRLFLFTLDQQSLYARIGWRRLETTVWRGRSADIMFMDLEPAVGP
jgi:N-acetylglutamate synthase-like GNAT family acetyltransferase